MVSYDNARTFFDLADIKNLNLFVQRFDNCLGKIAKMNEVSITSICFEVRHHRRAMYRLLSRMKYQLQTCASRSETIEERIIEIQKFTQISCFIKSLAFYDNARTFFDLADIKKFEFISTKF